jgi:type VI secretion system VgrG family protein
MAGIENLAIKFESDAVAEHTLVVTRLVGEERLSAPFRFQLDLMSHDAKVDLEAVLYAPARLGLEGATGGEGRAFRWFHGALESLTEVDSTHGLVRYRAVLVPDLWRLSQFSRSRIFQNKTIDELAAAVLEADLGLQAGQDFEARLARTGQGDRKTRDVYPEREYVVQYEETDLDFLSRWLEHEGVFYFFENDGTREKVVFADAPTAYKPARSGKPVRYHPEGGGGERGGGGATASGALEEVTSFVCTEARQPARVVLNDYNWRDPAVKLATSQAPEGRGLGTLHEYNDHYKTPAQGKALAGARADEARCRTRTFQGKGTCRSFRAGRTFDLEGHFRADFDAGYVVVAVRHEADQSVNFEVGSVTSANYQNSFEAIPKDRAFRPARVTAWPSIKGVMHARIDSAGEGDFADLDDEGRYLVRIPFDEAETDDAARPKDGTASRRVRMAQPYAVKDGGFHFPLLKGTEVLLTHIDGDPDRPIIVSAVPNPETASPVDRENHKQNRIHTTSGNTLVLDDGPTLAGYFFTDPGGSHIRDLRNPVEAPTGKRTLTGGLAGEAPPLAPPPGQGRVVPARNRRGRRPSPARVLTAAEEALLRKVAAAGHPLPPGLLERPGPDGGRAGDNVSAAVDGPTTIQMYLDRWADDAGLVTDALAKFDAYGGLLGTDVGHLDAQSIANEAVAAEAQFIQDTGAVAAGCVAAPLADTGYKFGGDNFGCTLAINNGSEYEIQSGDYRFCFNDCTKSLEVSTPNGWSIAESLGDQRSDSIFRGTLTEDSKHWGDKISTSEHKDGKVDETDRHWGKKVSRSEHFGDSDSNSLHIGDDLSFDMSAGQSQSTTIRAGNDQSVDLFGGNKNEASVVLGLAESLSVEVGGKHEVSITLSIAEATSIVLGVAHESSILIGPTGADELVLGPVANNSIVVGPKNETELVLGPFNGMSLVLAPKGETALTVGYKASLDATLGQVDSIEVAIIKNEVAMVLGFQSEINILVGGKLSIDLAIGAIVELSLALTFGLKVEISTDGIKEITIPKKDEVALQKNLIALQEQVTALQSTNTQAQKSVSP